MAAKPPRLPRKAYQQELFRLQAELVRMQEWVRSEGARVAVVFEGRDAAGKGSTIKRVTEYLNPRIARIAALPAPTERERTQWYFQRYIEHLPAGGQIVLFDRSWYNRAGVERVMGFCTKEEYHRFLHQCPIFERLLVEDGILLRKYWFSVSDAEQERRFRSRLDDPMRQWKLSPMDLESVTRWEDYSRAKDEMFVHTDIPEAPWYVVESEDKRRARINMIAHLLSTIHYHDVQRVSLTLPQRPKPQGYVRAPREEQTYVPDHAATLAAHGRELARNGPPAGDEGPGIWSGPAGNAEEMIEVTVASLAAHPFLRDVRPDLLARLVPAASAVKLPARRPMFEEGGHASRFWLIRSGAVALGLDAPGRGLVVVQTVGRGEVLGWSWLFPPYRWAFEAVTTEPVEAFEFDAPAVRAACDADPYLGYEMTRRFIAVVAGRLQVTRFRLLHTT